MKPVIAGVVVFTSVMGIVPQVQSMPESSLEAIEKYSHEGGNNLEQVTSVSQLRDVSPGDWAFEALRNLVERYACIAGYPNGTFQGNRSLTRYEFAAGLNACLQQIERLIGNSNNDNRGGIDNADLPSLERLVQEFQPELKALGARIDSLETRVGVLEDNQFSTTTKLTGESVFAVASNLAGDGDQVAVLGHRTRIDLNTSFTGKDELYTRLATGNFPEFGEVNGTGEGELAFAQPDDNNVGLEVLLYRFPLGENTTVLVAAKGGAADDFAQTLNFLDGDGASGAISAFGTRNPIYYQVDEAAGLGITTQLGKSIELSLGYMAPNANDPTPGNGLFNGAYSALGQVVFKPSDRFQLGLTYIHGNNTNDTGTGSNLSNFRSFTEDNFGEAVPISSNSYGVELSWKLSDRFILGGWAGYTQARTLSSLGGQINRGDLDILNWAVTLALPDLGKEGNLAGIIVGMEPKVINSSIDGTEDVDTSLHIEGLYQWKVNDNIAITPGVIWLTAPDHNSKNKDAVIGTIRTTFTF